MIRYGKQYSKRGLCLKHANASSENGHRSGLGADALQLLPRFIRAGNSDDMTSGIALILWDLSGRRGGAVGCSYRLHLFKSAMGKFHRRLVIMRLMRVVMIALITAYC